MDKNLEDFYKALEPIVKQIDDDIKYKDKIVAIRLGKVKVNIIPVSKDHDEGKIFLKSGNKITFLGAMEEGKEPLTTCNIDGINGLKMPIGTIETPNTTILLYYDAEVQIPVQVSIPVQRKKSYAIVNLLLDEEKY